MKLIKCACVYIYLFIMSNHTVHTTSEPNAIISKTWCWTKPIYTSSDSHDNNNNNTIYTNGGINWGMCKHITPLYKDEHIQKEYIIYIRTSSLPNSEAHGVIMISLIGSEATSKEIELTSSGFRSGAFDKMRVFAEDVGDLYAIKLIAKNRLQWRCNTIRIESHMNFWDFRTPISTVDQAIWDSTFFLLAGKMYAIFAMLFGLSFFIQHDNHILKYILQVQPPESR